MFECWGVIYTFEHGSQILDQCFATKAEAELSGSGKPHTHIARLYEVTDDEATWIKDKRSKRREAQEPNGFHYTFQLTSDEYELVKKTLESVRIKLSSDPPYRFENGQEFDEHAALHLKCERAQKQEERKNMPYDATVNNTIQRDTIDTVNVAVYLDSALNLQFIKDTPRLKALPGWKRVRVRFT